MDNEQAQPLPQTETGDEDGGAPAPRPVPVRARKRARRKVMRGQSITLANLVVKREPNVQLALSVLAYITTWGVYVETHDGQWPRSSRELALASDIPVRTMLRWHERFLRVFPEYPSPRELWATIRDQVGDVDVENVDALTLSIGSVVVS